MDCLVCSDAVDDELVCTLCVDHQLHFLCGFGAVLNNNTWRTYFKKGNYICPVCIVGRDNALVLKSVSTNQHHIKVSNNVTDTHDESVASVQEPEEQLQENVQEVEEDDDEATEANVLDTTAGSENDLYASSSLCLGGANFLVTPTHPHSSSSRHSARPTEPTVHLPVTQPVYQPGPSGPSNQVNISPGDVAKSKKTSVHPEGA